MAKGFFERIRERIRDFFSDERGGEGFAPKGIAPAGPIEPERRQIPPPPESLDNPTPSEFIQYLKDRYEHGDTDPFIQPFQAADAIQKDYPEWQTAIDANLTDAETAARLASFGVDNPYDVTMIGIDFDNDNWTLRFETNNGETIVIDLGSDSIPLWVWDEVYDLADDMGWDWEITYTEVAA